MMFEYKMRLKLKALYYYLTNTNIFVSVVDRVPIRNGLEEAFRFIVEKLHY